MRDVSKHRRLCVFCGSRNGARPSYLEAARRLGGELVRRDIGLVYGGASVGLMGAIADEVLARGGEAIGVIPETLVAREVAHLSLTEQYIVPDMHQRKAKMAQLADAFVAIPGGLGTLEELFEVATWAMLGIHQKPIALLDVDGYYEGLSRFLGHARDEGFVDERHLGLLPIVRDVDTLFSTLFPPPLGA